MRAELDDGVAKIRAAFDADKTRMKHAHGLAVQGLQLVALEALLLPDALEELFRRRFRRFAQRGGETLPGPPVGVTVEGDGLHLELLLRGRSRKVKRSLAAGAERIEAQDVTVKMKTRLSRRALGKTGWLGAWLLSLGMLRAAVVPAVGPEVDIRRDATVAAIEKVTPSVVNIRTSKIVRRNTAEEEILRRYFGWKIAGSGQPEEQINSIGSGVIVEATDDEGYILTNFHVLQQAERVQVQLWDGREYEAEKLLWTMQKDLALLKIVRRAGDKPFRPVSMALDDDLLLGETVIAMGNPFGLGGSVSRGILSSKNRRSDSGGMKLDYPDWLQTDADINPGNSGGPLVNIRGELIGINVAVYNQEEGKGTGFAIPVKQISSALSDFFTLEWTAKLWLGARFLGAPHPLMVREVQVNSPAYRAGLRLGQEVVEVNGKPVNSLAKFTQLVAASPERRAAITINDNGTRHVCNVELMPLTDLNRELFAQRLGLVTTPLTEQQATNADLPFGLLVSDVEKNSPAANAKLEAGMIIAAADNVAVGDLVNVSNVLGNKKRGDSVRLTVKVANRYPSGFVRWLTGQVDVPAR